MKTRSIVWLYSLSSLVILRNVSGQGVIGTNSQQSAKAPPIGSLQEQMRLPGVVSSAPVLAALFCVVLLCLVWAGMKVKQKDVRRARQWLVAALACVVVWGLAVLIVDAFAAQ